MNMATHEAKAGDPACSAGLPMRAVAQEADELRAKLNATLDALADEVENSNTLRLQVEALGAELARFTPLRAKGVVDADDNLDCWDTDPYEICTLHVAALNEKDPAAMWRVVELHARDLGPNARA